MDDSGDIPGETRAVAAFMRGRANAPGAKTHVACREMDDFSPPGVIVEQSVTRGYG